jgi:glutathione S-transferase
LKRGEMLFNEFAGVLDAHLAGRQWVSGTSLSLPDLSIAAAYGCAAPGRAPVSAYANIQSWFERVQDLDVWKRTEEMARAVR